MSAEEGAGSERGFWEAYYRTSFVYDSRRDTVWKEVCRFLQENYIPPDSRILDLGAGYCSFINNIRGRDKHAMDIISAMAQHASADVVVHELSCARLDIFADAYFDVVFASNLFEHLSREDLAQLLRELHRTIRPGGRLIALQPNFKFCMGTYFDDYTHLQIFTDRGLCELLAAHGFGIFDVKPRFLPVNMKSTLRFELPRLDLIVRAYLRSPFKPKAAQMLVVAER